MDFGFSSLIVPAFFAGILTFFAPCTLPLVPGFLAFISGLSPEELQNKEHAQEVRRTVLFNGFLYVLGFSLVFILLGSVFGIGGSLLVEYRELLARIGGLFIIIFGLFLIGFSNWKWFSFMNSEKKLHLNTILKPGNPGSSFLFGVTFAFGWTPCVGPILGSVLLLASTAGTAVQGTLLLTVFAIGLGLPFMITAAALSGATTTIKKINKYLPIISKIGGIFLILFGLLLLTDQLQLWIRIVYDFTNFLGYEKLLVDFL